MGRGENLSCNFIALPSRRLCESGSSVADGTTHEERVAVRPPNHSETSELQQGTLTLGVYGTWLPFRRRQGDAAQAAPGARAPILGAGWTGVRCSR